MVTLSCQLDKPQSGDPFRAAAVDLRRRSDRARLYPCEEMSENISMGWNKFCRRAWRLDACTAASRLPDA
jgi:hypothetical protein